MSKFIFILCSFLLITNCIYGQEEKQQTQVKLKYNPFKTPIEDHDDIWEVKFGSAHLLPNTNSMQSNKFSFNLGLQYFYEINLNPQKRFAIAIGIGYNFQQLKLNGIFIDSPENVFIPSDQIFELSNPRLNIHEINTPIEFRVKLKSELKFYLGYNFTVPVANTLKFKQEGKERKEKNLSPLEAFQHGPSLRIGFKDVFLFARYNLSNTFLSSKTQRVNLFSFGISLGG